jgi:hypothetical protein
MKKLIAAFLFIAQLSFAQDQKGIARVNRIDGVEVYFMNEPLNAYDVVFDVTSGGKATSFITGAW